MNIVPQILIYLIINNGLTSCQSCPAELCKLILPGLWQAVSAPWHSCAQPSHPSNQSESSIISCQPIRSKNCFVLTNQNQESFCLNQSEFIISNLGHCQSTPLGAWDRFLGIVFTFLQVDGERVEFSHHRTPVQLIITPATITILIGQFLTTLLLFIFKSLFTETGSLDLT